MKFPLVLIAVGTVMASALAQQPPPAATPKKDPFSGFGNTALDRNKPGKPTPSPFAKPPKTTTPSTTTFAPTTGSETGTGIVLANGWQGHMSQSAGGQTMKLDDLRALMKGFGKPEADIAAHPEVLVYEGPQMDGAKDETCRITYLMPLREAETLLFKSRGITTASRAVAPGLPDGLYLHTYDVHAGIYNRLVLVTDGAKPEPQVVSLLLKAEGDNYHPPTPFRKIERDWHTYDYVNTENRGQSSIQIDTRVRDARAQKQFIVVNTTGTHAPLPLELAPPGIHYQPAKASPRETTTWYVPQPLIHLILYCLQNQLAQ